MEATVFIPTYNGKERLKFLLENIYPKENSTYQVKVLIDGSNDSTIELKEKFINSVEFHEFENKGRAGIKNEALHLCSTPFMIFLDDDMNASRELIESHCKLLKENSDTIFVGQGFRDPTKSNSSFLRFLSEQEQKWLNNQPDQFEVTDKKFAFTSCNLSMSHSTFLKLNGFDSQLKDGEDFDLGRRALKNQIRIVYSKKLKAYHNDYPDLRSYIKRNKEYLLGKMRLLELKPEYSGFLNTKRFNPNDYNRIELFIIRLITSLAINETIFFKILPFPFKRKAYRITLYYTTSFEF